MSSFNPAFGGFGYDHGSKRNFSPGNLLPAFAHSTHFGYDQLSGGTSVPAFEQSVNRSYPYGYAPAVAGISMSPFTYCYPLGFTPSNFGNSPPAFGHNSHPFGFIPNNVGNSAPAFGHNSHSFGFTPSNGGSSAHAFGHNSHPFGFTPTSGGASAPTLGQSNSFGFTPGGTFVPIFGQNCSPFGSSPANGGTSVPTFGQNSSAFVSTPANGGMSVPTFGQKNSPFGSAPANGSPFGSAPANGGTSVPTFGQNSSPFGSAPANGGTSVPTFGQNSSPFESAPANGGTSVPTFGQNSSPFGSAPGNGGTSVPTFGQNRSPFGSAPANGGTSVPIFRQNSSPFGSTPANGRTSVPTFGQNSSPFGSAPANGGTSVPTFGQNKSPFGSSPAYGGTSVPTFGQHSSAFGSAPANGGTSVPLFGESSTPFGCAPAIGGTSVPLYERRTNPFGFTPSNSTTPVPSWQRSTLGSVPPNGGTAETTLGEGRTYFVSAPTPFSGGSTSYIQTPAVNASISPGFGFGCTTTCSQPTLPAGSSLFGAGLRPFGTPDHLSGDQVKTPFSGGSSSESFTFSVNHGGTRATPYSETVELDGNSVLSRMMSISAMPGFRDKSHEELRWEDKQLGDNGNIPLFHSVRSGQSAIGSQSKGSKVMPYSETMDGEDGTKATSISAMPVYQHKSHEELRWEDHQFNNTGGVDHALEQLNCFRNSVSGTGSSFLNAMNSSVPPNLFASSPPCFTFSTINNPFKSNSSLNDSPAGAFTSITQPPISSPTITFSHPNPSIMSASASEASTSGPTLFNYTSSAPCASICSTTPATASVPCNFPPSTSTLNAVSPSKCAVETPLQVPQMSAEGPATASVRYGISSIPVKHSAVEEKRLLQTTKWYRKDDGLKVSFSADAHETHTTARKKIPLLPKNDSGVLISGPSKDWNLRINFENFSHIKHTSIHVYENGEISVELSRPLADGSVQNKIGNPGETFATEAEHSPKPKSVNGNHPFKKEVASDVFELLPTIKDSEYFIQPQVEELAVKESFEPGFCSHVKDFVVGHERYGHIKFLGETDVRQLDVNSHIVFGNREVILSVDENKKPPVGRGLNKAAEITLYNIKCVDKAGNQLINGPKVDTYRKKLMKKAAEQGAEFVSYDPVQGEWKFRV